MAITASLHVNNEFAEIKNFELKKKTSELTILNVSNCEMDWQNFKHEPSLSWIHLLT